MISDGKLGVWHVGNLIFVKNINVGKFGDNKLIYINCSMFGVRIKYICR